MFDIGITELALIGLLALLLLGPKRLPEVARTAGRWLGNLRRFINSVKEDFDQELRSEELAELRKLQQELSETRQVMERSSSEALQRLEREIEEEHPQRTHQPASSNPSKKRPTSASGSKRARKTASPAAKPAQPAKRAARTGTGSKHGRARRSR